MLILPEGQAGKTFEYSKKQCSFGNKGAFERKLLSLLGHTPDGQTVHRRASWSWTKSSKG
jgi:hypothetical protein